MSPWERDPWKQKRYSPFENKQGNERKAMKNKMTTTPFEIHGQAKISNSIGVTWTKALGIIALAFCFWTQSSNAIPGHAVSRPVKIIEGHMTIVINPFT